VSGSPGTGNVATFSSLWRSRTALDPTVELPAVLVTGSYLYPGSVWQGSPVRGHLSGTTCRPPESPFYFPSDSEIPASYQFFPPFWPFHPVQTLSSPGNSTITCKYSNNSIDDIIRYNTPYSNDYRNNFRGTFLQYECMCGYNTPPSIIIIIPCASKKTGGSTNLN